MVVAVRSSLAPHELGVDARAIAPVPREKEGKGAHGILPPAGRSLESRPALSKGGSSGMPRRRATAGQFKYDLDLVGTDFRGLLNFYPTYEQRTVNDCVGIFIKGLEARGALPKGHIVLIDDRPYEIVSEMSRLTRELRISVLPKFGTRAQLVEQEILIDHFGSIRKLRIGWPAAVEKRCRSLVGQLQDHVLAAYVGLEVAFLSKFDEVDRALFKNLYELLSIRLLRANRPDLLRQCWLSVTKLKSLRFRYHFTHQRIAEMVAHFKSHQLEQFSPFELVVCLLSEEVPDSLFAAGIKADQGFVSFPFVGLVTLSSNTEFWTAEAALFSDSDLAAREICTCDDYSLQLNCPARSSRELETLIEPARVELAEQFKTNLQDYKAVNRALEHLSRPLRDARTYSVVRDFLAEVISRTVRAVVSPGP